MSKYSQKIPEVQKISNAGDLLPDSVVDYPIKNKEECFKISFEKYKKRECDLEHLEKSSYKKALKWIKDACSCVSQEDVYRLGKGDDITRAQKYEFLFHGLTEDADIKEFKLCGTNRIFYYIDDAKKTINCILFKSTHL